MRELPRVMTIYDVDLPLKSAREAINYHFRKNHALQDGRHVIDRCNPNFISHISN